MFIERPIIAAIHPKMVEELKKRKEEIELATGKKARGGLTCFSEMAAHELKLIRMSGEQLFKEVCKLDKPPIKTFVDMGTTRQYVPYDIFKKLYLYAGVLNKKKDHQQIVLEVVKLKGIKKNEIQFSY